jgi:hypothetical protein
MRDWLRAFHGANATFPASEIAIKVVLSLALGLLVGFERQWSNKDIGARTFAMAAPLPLLGSLLGSGELLLAGVAALIVMSSFSPIFAICRLHASWRQLLQLRS